MENIFEKDNEFSKANAEGAEITAPALKYSYNDFTQSRVGTSILRIL